MNVSEETITAADQMAIAILAMVDLVSDNEDELIKVLKVLELIPIAVNFADEYRASRIRDIVGGLASAN